MRNFGKAVGKIRSLLILSVLGLAACGTTEQIDDVSRVERSDMVPSTTEILRAAPKSSERVLAKTAELSKLLNEDTNAMLNQVGFDVDLDVVSYMIPNRIQTEISGARAYLSTNVTLRNAASGEVLAHDVAMTFVTPIDGPSVTDSKALVVAFCEHLEKSLKLR